jgi:hypothetical protein
VFFGGSQETITNIYRSNFTNNVAVQGAVFYVESESIVRLYDSLIEYNFAIISGVIQASNNGIFEFHNTIIRNNYAVSSSVSQMFDVAGTSVVSNSSIYDNIVLDSDQVTTEISGECSLLCFLSETYKQFLINNPSVYSIQSINRVFQLISANIEISTNSEFYSSDAVITSYLSTVNITDSVFRDIHSTSANAITLATSTMYIEDTQWYDISSTSGYSAIRVSSESNIIANGLTFENST